MTAPVTTDFALYKDFSSWERETATMSLANSLSCALESSMKMWQVSGANEFVNRPRK